MVFAWVLSKLYIRFFNYLNRNKLILRNDWTQYRSSGLRLNYTPEIELRFLFLIINRAFSFKTGMDNGFYSWLFLLIPSGLGLFFFQRITTSLKHLSIFLVECWGFVYALAFIYFFICLSTLDASFFAKLDILAEINVYQLYLDWLLDVWRLVRVIVFLS